MNDRLTELELEVERALGSISGSTPFGAESRMRLEKILSKVHALRQDSSGGVGERVPICGTKGLTVSRAIWDEAMIAYQKEYGANEGQHARLLRQGFYAEELDALRPGWRPVEQRIAELEAHLAAPQESRSEVLDAREREVLNSAIRCLESEWGPSWNTPDGIAVLKRIVDRAEPGAPRG